MPKKQFSIRLDAELCKKLEDYRWDNRKSLNEIINEVVKQFLEYKRIQKN